ncbi:scavenger receptor cysteine-rich domain superfamily protein-like [Mytilus galloprovincialis]|uniref:scavenger receptor cysteine-rich domain superfamily protein-like n=1 Tax=Mytilus galloprovincialis TaxID=29158 RepID=UPI003F7BC32A
MLGKDLLHPVIFPGSHFGSGNGTIWLSDLDCVSHEADISLCTNSGWGTHSCRHGEDVGLNCDTDVRLVHGKSVSEGRLEIFHDNIWGTVCNNNFDTRDAMVICRILGYKNAYVISFYIFLATQIRLVGGSVPTEGRVEVFHKGKWGTICDDLFDVNDAKVLCRTMGFRLEIRVNASKLVELLEVKLFGQWGAVCADDFGYTEADVACRMMGYKESYGQPFKTLLSLEHVSMRNVKCTGKEYDLRHCHFNAGYGSNCSHAVVLECGDTEHKTVQLTHGYYGSIKVKHNGEWGSICDDHFEQNDGKVACASAGYHTL